MMSEPKRMRHFNRNGGDHSNIFESIQPYWLIGSVKYKQWVTVFKLAFFKITVEMTICQKYIRMTIACYWLNPNAELPIINL